MSKQIMQLVYEIRGIHHGITTVVVVLIVVVVAHTAKFIIPYQSWMMILRIFFFFLRIIRMILEQLIQCPIHDRLLCPSLGHRLTIILKKEE